MLLVAYMSSLAGAKPDTETIYYGLADASAAVFLDDAHFALADDESNEIRIYKVGTSERPASLSVMGHLPVEAKSPETDIEGAARVGDRVYWITSHGRNKDGKPRPNRYALFATRVKADETSGPTLIPEGRVCRTLAHQMAAFESPVQTALKEATQLGADLSKKDQKKLAPKEKGLNIEGLCPYPANRSLLIGLRNPLFRGKGDKAGKAIVVELLNPAEIIDKGADARFGRVLLWDLARRGIRGMEYADKQKRFYILAGPTDSETTCAMYAWDGDFETAPKLIHEWPGADDFTPEGIAEAPDGKLWLFSDDGTLEIEIASPAECTEGELLPNGKCPNKFLTDQTRKSFRVRVFDLAVGWISGN
jgi:hypothetical protein